jgi:hypothetical protein
LQHTPQPHIETPSRDPQAIKNHERAHAEALKSADTAADKKAYNSVTYCATDTGPLACRACLLQE